MPCRNATDVKMEHHPRGGLRQRQHREQHQQHHQQETALKMVSPSLTRPRPRTALIQCHVLAAFRLATPTLVEQGICGRHRLRMVRMGAPSKSGNRLLPIPIVTLNGRWTALPKQQRHLLSLTFWKQTLLLQLHLL